MSPPPGIRVAHARKRPNILNEKTKKKINLLNLIQFGVVAVEAGVLVLL